MKRVDERYPIRRNRPGADPEALAAQALGYIAEDEERLGDFLAVTGLTPGSLRDAAGSPEFLRGVLGYVAADEALLVGLASHLGVPPESVGHAIAAALGGQHDGHDD